MSIPFSKDELNKVGEYSSMFPGMPGTPKYNTPISPKENFIKLLNGEKPLWIPTGNDGVTLITRVIPDNIARALVFDVDPLRDEERGGKDMFGIEWEYIPVATGSMVKPGNPTLDDANNWREFIKMPDIDSWPWEESAKAHAAFIDDGRLSTHWIMTGLFERLISFMDFDKAAMALIDEDQQDAVHDLFSFLCDVYEKIILNFKKYYHADVVYFHDDWGAQRAPFFSLNTAREMLVPYFKRLADFCHANGMYLNHHCCGKVEMLIPAMIEAGTDIWSGQDLNDKAMLIEKYGDQILIEIGPSEPFTFTSTPEDGEKAAKEWMEKFGANFEKKPCIASAFFGPATFGETIYEMSRQTLA